MVPYSQLPEIVESIGKIEYSDFGYRAVDAYEFRKYGEDCFYADGPQKDGGRYSPIGVASALYYSESYMTAIRERGSGISGLSSEPESILQMKVHVKVKAVFDLADRKIRRKLGTSLDELKLPWIGDFPSEKDWPATWHIGKAVFLSGRFDAIRYPSSQHNRHYCFLVFPDRLSPGTFIKAIHPEKKEVVLRGKYRLKR